MDFLLNIASSAYFVLGAALIILISIILIIMPMMNRQKKLDNIVIKKLNMIPTQSTNELIDKRLAMQQQLHASREIEHANILSALDVLTNVVREVADKGLSVNIIEQINDHIDKFYDRIVEIDERIVDFASYMQDNEKQTIVQIENLVAARIDTTKFLIHLVERLEASDLIKNINTKHLEDITKSLQTGLDSVRQNRGNYTVYEANRRSGRIDRFTSDKY